LDRAESPPAPKADAPPNPAATEPGYLGLVTEDRSESGKGVRVREAVADGPGAKGGIKTGDLITGVNGKPVHSMADLAAVIGAMPPGSRAAFDVDRDGQTIKFDVTLGQRPPPGERRFERFGAIDEPLPIPAPSRRDVGPPGGAASEPPRMDTARRQLLGVRTQVVSEELRRRLRLPSASGALVVSRAAGSPAEKAGIPLESVIVAVDAQPVDSPSDLARLIAQAGAGREVELSFIVDGQTRQARVKLAEAAFETPAAPPGPPIPAVPPRVPNRAGGPMPQDDRGRIEALERHVQELEQRIRELEAGRK